MTILEMEGLLHDLIGASLDYIANPIEDNFMDLRDVTILASAALAKHQMEEDQYHSQEEANADRD